LWYACTFGVCDHFGGVKQQERMTDMAVGPTRALQLCCSERRPSRHGVSTLHQHKKTAWREHLTSAQKNGMARALTSA
jgi:hypothetical protein